MNSMTGFGFGETTTERYQIAVEIKSYNNRYLDLLVYLPNMAHPLEPRLRETVGKLVKRGRVEVAIKLRELEEDLTVRVNPSAARQYLSALEEVKTIAGMGEALTLDQLLSFDEIFKQEKNRDLDALWEEILPVLNKALDDFGQSRKKEGAKTKEDLLAQLKEIRAGREFVFSKSKTLEQSLKESLETKFEEFLPQIDENRVLAEVAVLLMRYGINEELVRLDSHLEQFDKILGQKGPVGKKLDFLCQEIGREINTIGSKTTLPEVQHRVVDMKDALENLREQLRNVE
jgi:uncharacterized protein (TIGR00255 family)